MQLARRPQLPGLDVSRHRVRPLKQLPFVQGGRESLPFHSWGVRLLNGRPPGSWQSSENDLKVPLCFLGQSVLRLVIGLTYQLECEPALGLRGRHRCMWQSRVVVRGSCTLESGLQHDGVEVLFLREQDAPDSQLEERRNG